MFTQSFATSSLPRSATYVSPPLSLPTRWPYGKTIPRPFLIKMTDMSNTIITNVFLKDSPAFHLLVRGENISVTHVRIEANIEACAGYDSAPNTGEKRIANKKCTRSE